ncbi:MAG: ATP-binding protein [Acidobacteria bacterium]|nr:ATP-binding protein [Acidobacteriota bacterium]
MSWIPTSRDAVWVLLFLALHFSSRIVNDAEAEMLAAFAIFEIVEPRIGYFQRASQGRFLGVAIRLLLAYLLMGVTGGITSSYYLILLLPVVRAATLFGPLVSLIATLVAALSYLSFLLYLDFATQVIPQDQQQEISFRILFLFLAAYLTYQLARTNREQAVRYQTLASEFATANENLKAAQSEVQRSERLAALGQLTAGLAHELRNPLGTIKNSAEMLAKRLPGADPIARELSGYISTEVDRTNELVKRFLDFARPFRLRVEAAELTEVIDRAIQQVENRAAQHKVTIIRNDSPDVGPLPIDAQWIEQLVANLLGNAIDASAEGSAVTILTRPAEGGSELVVVDRGAGIAPESIASVFNPFFTTKADGTGLGLAIVSKIVDEHRGRIHVESVPGEGSTFRVWLPDRQEMPE